MNKFLDKAKAKFGRDQVTHQQPIDNNQAQGDRPSTVQQPTYADVQRYRYHHGTNLGTVFILERWICGCMFPEGSEGSSELAAAKAWVQKEGMEATQARFEQHWREYLSDADLDWLRDVAKCTTVRLPIGFFTLGPPYCQGTAFEPVAQIYTNAWPAVKALVARLQERGIGTLVDMHGLPGGANAQDHSGTNSGKAEFVSSSNNKSLATRCLAFVAQEVKGIPGVIGIQIVNESESNSSKMFDWYDQVIKELSGIDPSMPLYISDGWDMHKTTSWSQSLNKIASSSSPIVVDTHVYWAFADHDKEKTPQTITSEAESKLNDIGDGSVVDRGAAQVVVGEYSCVLTEESWSKCGGDSKEQLTKNFGNAQSHAFQQRAGGSFFWTYRMDWMPGGGWGFKNMTEDNAIVPPVSLTLSKEDVQGKISEAQSQQENRKQQTVSSHIDWWDNNHPGEYEHWRFEQGWDLGYGDALQFFGMRAQQGLNGGDKIGMLDLWCLRRIRESGQAGNFIWEFEQGLRQGVRDCYQALGL